MKIDKASAVESRTFEEEVSIFLRTRLKSLKLHNKFLKTKYEKNDAIRFADDAIERTALVMKSVRDSFERN